MVFIRLFHRKDWFLEVLKSIKDMPIVLSALITGTISCILLYLVIFGAVAFLFWEIPPLYPPTMSHVEVRGIGACLYCLACLMSNALLHDCIK